MMESEEYKADIAAGLDRYSAKIRQEFRDMGPDKADAMLRDLEVESHMLRAAGHDVRIRHWPALYSKFQDLEVVRNAAEAIYEARKRLGVPEPPPLSRVKVT